MRFHHQKRGRVKPSSNPQKRLYAVQNTFSFLQEKGRFGGLDREQVKARLHGKVMPQSVPVLHFRYHNTPNRYSSSIFSKKRGMEGEHMGGWSPRETDKRKPTREREQQVMSVGIEVRAVEGA